MDATGKLRGWLRASRRHSAADQREVLLQHGASVVYEAGRDTIEQFIRDLRSPAGKAKGDIALVTTLGRLANRREEIMDAVRGIHGKGAVILEATTGRRSNNPANLLEMIDAALDELRADKRSHTKERAAELGSLGGKQRAANIEAQRTSENEALLAWRDLSLTTDEALDTGYMRGWTQTAAYDRLGRRNTAPGAKAGRQRKRS